MSLTPIVAIHMTAAIAATVLGPFALWARLGLKQRPKVHRAFGYAWVTLMIVTALSAIFIRSKTMNVFGGFSPIHLLIPIALGVIVLAFRSLSKGQFHRHKMQMIGVYVGSCIIAGGFTLFPGRYLGDLVWKQWLGLI